MQNNKVKQNCKILSTPTTSKKIPRVDDTPKSSQNKSPKILKLIETKFIKQNEIMITNIKACVKESVDEALTSIEAKITTLSNKVDELCEQINIIECKQIEKGIEMQRMKNELDVLKQQIAQQNNIKVSKNLRLCGVPFCENENLITMFQNLCNSINIMPPAIKSIQRLQPRIKGNTTNDGVILVKLFTSFERNNILKAVSRFKKQQKTQLPLRIIGFDTDVPFFVNEDLTSANFKILQNAISLKKKKILSTTFTLRGLVYVKCFDTDEAIRIESFDKLNSLFPFRSSSSTIANTGNGMS